MIRTSKIFLLMIIMASAFMISCEEEIIIDTGTFESKLVVNALFNHESPWSVEISNSDNRLDNSTQIENITFAKVEIYDQNDDFLYELYHTENGIYSRDDVAPSPKRGYSIKVTATGYHSVTARSFVPEKTKLLINNSSITTNETYDDVEVDFEIEDRSELDSYYIWEIVSLDKGDDGGDDNETLSTSWINDLTNKSNGLETENREILDGNSFGDGTYNGTYNSIDGNKRIGRTNLSANDPLVNYIQEISSQGKIGPKKNIPEEIKYNDFINDISSEDGEGDKVVAKYELRVMSISKELYDYYSSVEKYIKYHNEGKHHNVYTNVSNGLGIFAGFSESVVQF